MSAIATFLSGVRVVDLSQYVPGPFATLMLGDMGAEVIKVEPPRGDEMERLGPVAADGRPIFYRALNAGKSVCRLDLKSDDGRATLRDILSTADVLVEGFRPGVMARLGLDQATLAPLYPRLIYCSISGYGASGPLATRAAHDGNYLASAGIMHRNGMPPTFYDPPVADMAGALFAATAILGALHGRHSTGRGAHIDLGLADVLMPLQLMQVADWGANGTVPQPKSTYLNGGAAYYNSYATADGRHVMLGAVEAKFWQRFCEVADRPGWIARQDEPTPQSGLIAEVAAFFAALTCAQAAALFDDADCCFCCVIDLGTALESPQVAARGLVRRSAGDLQALFPAWIDGEAPAARQPVVMADPARSA